MGKSGRLGLGAAIRAILQEPNGRSSCHVETHFFKPWLNLVQDYDKTIRLKGTQAGTYIFQHYKANEEGCPAPMIVRHKKSVKKTTLKSRPALICDCLGSQMLAVTIS